ncbi:MAG: hypothetical protein PHO26_11160 [Dehalococcoidia bacterium]|nr:hypothetical protein [Dehalococcoidia bacterium]MDD5493601.1 hypothetical protein [Dehalococcoidia bacterium]
MANEQWTSRPYEDQELLSFDRLRRAVMNRIIERAEALMDVEFPLSQERQDLLVSEEWENAKIAVRNSPTAKEAYRKYLEQTMGGRLEDHMKRDKEELGAMGVQEKSL